MVWRPSTPVQGREGLPSRRLPLALPAGLESQVHLKLLMPSDSHFASCLALWFAVTLSCSERLPGGGLHEARRCQLRGGARKEHKAVATSIASPSKNESFGLRYANVALTLVTERAHKGLTHASLRTELQRKLERGREKTPNAHQADPLFRRFRWCPRLMRVHSHRPDLCLLTWIFYLSSFSSAPSTPPHWPGPRH